MKAINAIICSSDVKLVCDNRYLDFPIELRLASGGHVMFGGRVLCHAHDDDADTNYAGIYICKVFDVVGVNSISSLKDMPVRAILAGTGGVGAKIIGIQNFLDYNKYFIPETNLSEDDIKEITKV